MKKRIILVIFCAFFVNNALHAQVFEDKFYLKEDYVTGKMVLWRSNSPFSGDKSMAQILDYKNFIESNDNRILILKETDNGKVSKSVYFYKDYRWVLVQDKISLEFSVKTEDQTSLTTLVRITYIIDKHTEEFYY
jgi:hypothetical protein